MSTLIWISGGSGGIGRALAEAVPGDDARIIDISRSAPPGVEHVEVDLSDPASWPVVGESFRSELEGFDGDRVLFIHAAGVVEPIGFAGEVDDDSYAANVIINSAVPQALGHLSWPRSTTCPPTAISSCSPRARLAASTRAGPPTAPARPPSTSGSAMPAPSSRVRGGVQVLSVAPGSVDTAFQEQLRSTSEEDFPKRQKFLDLYEEGKLSDPAQVAETVWSLPERGLENGSVVELRELD